jgi:glycopeptide antibiotics resistance protein
MTFSYFLFDTYAGYFLEALPLAVIVSGVFYFVKYKNDKETAKMKRIGDCLFICYLTGLFELVLFLDIMRNIWFFIIYHKDSVRELRFFDLEFNFIPDFWNHLNGEVIGNLIMFIPFGVLYSWKQIEFDIRKTLKYGILCILGIEILQPVFGRSFDINDILMNTAGVVMGIFIYLLFKKLVKKFQVCF